MFIEQGDIYNVRQINDIGDGSDNDGSDSDGDGNLTLLQLPNAFYRR